MKVNNNSVNTTQNNYKLSEKMPKVVDAVKVSKAPIVSSTNKTNHKAEEFDEEFMVKSVEQANKTLKQHNRTIQRNVHEVTKTVMYTVIDTQTDEVIAEFPPKKIQDMIAKMWELAGLFVDEKG